MAVATEVKKAGAKILRGGAFKPRTSPYAFQGLKANGLELLKLARKETGLPIVTEIMSVSALDLFEDVDIIQVGARNMQNFDLLQELGKLRKPILLKRGLANTMTELLMSAEYIMASGNEQVILCERGIRTYETLTRNTLDLSLIHIFSKTGERMVGSLAKRQAVTNHDRTITSIKRQMGTGYRVSIDGHKYTCLLYTSASKRSSRRGRRTRRPISSAPISSPTTRSASSATQAARSTGCISAALTAARMNSARTGKMPMGRTPTSGRTTVRAAAAGCCGEF